MAVELRSKSSRRVAFPRLAYSAPTLSEATFRDIMRLTRPATKALPFVRLRANDQPLWRPECYWCVEPSGNRKADFALGRRYARAALAAMKADDSSHLIADIVQDIIREEIARGGKAGRGACSPAARGFLAEISETIAS
jgi:hypothetical protein